MTLIHKQMLSWLRSLMFCTTTKTTLCSNRFLARLRPTTDGWVNLAAWILVIVAPKDYWLSLQLCYESSVTHLFRHTLVGLTLEGLNVWLNLKKCNFLVVSITTSLYDDGRGSVRVFLSVFSTTTVHLKPNITENVQKIKAIPFHRYKFDKWPLKWYVKL